MRSATRQLTHRPSTKSSEDCLCLLLVRQSVGLGFSSFLLLSLSPFLVFVFCVFFFFFCPRRPSVPRSDVTPRGFGEHAAGGIEHGPPQAKARRRRRGAGAEPLLRGGWDGEHSKAQAHKTRSRQTSLPAAAASEECSSADSSTGIRA